MKQLAFVFIIIAVVAAFFLLREDGRDGGGTPVRGMLPNVVLQDYEGTAVPLRELVGTPLVVNSWAVWCPFCKEELKAFAQVQREFGSQVRIVAIDRAESLETAKGFTDSIGITDDMTFLLDPSDSFYRAIGGFSMPETIFVDKSGAIQIHKRGPMDTEEIRSKVRELLES